MGDILMNSPQTRTSFNLDLNRPPWYQTTVRSTYLLMLIAAKGHCTTTIRETTVMDHGPSRITLPSVVFVIIVNFDYFLNSFKPVFKL